MCADITFNIKTRTVVLGGSLWAEGKKRLLLVIFTSGDGDVAIRPRVFSCLAKLVTAVGRLPSAH